MYINIDSAIVELVRGLLQYWNYCRKAWQLLLRVSDRKGLALSTTVRLLLRVLRKIVLQRRELAITDAFTWISVAAIRWRHQVSTVEEGMPKGDGRKARQLLLRDRKELAPKWLVTIIAERQDYLLSVEWQDYCRNYSLKTLGVAGRRMIIAERQSSYYYVSLTIRNKRQN